jgi:hypothetical protein
VQRRSSSSRWRTQDASHFTQSSNRATLSILRDTKKPLLLSAPTFLARAARKRAGKSRQFGNAAYLVVHGAHDMKLAQSCTSSRTCRCARCCSPRRLLSSPVQAPLLILPQGRPPRVSPAPGGFASKFSVSTVEFVCEKVLEHTLYSKDYHHH